MNRMIYVISLLAVTGCFHKNDNKKIYMSEKSNIIKMENKEQIFTENLKILFFDKNHDIDEKEFKDSAGGDLRGSGESEIEKKDF